MNKKNHEKDMPFFNFTRYKNQGICFFVIRELSFLAINLLIGLLKNFVCC